MIEVGTVVRCVPVRPGTVVPVDDVCDMHRWSGPKPPWADCSVEFGDVGVVEAILGEGDDAAPLKRIRFFRWPDEEIWLADMWLEVVDD